MKSIKLAIGATLAVIWGAIFLVMPAHAFMNDGATNGGNNGSVESTVKTDGEARGVANFTMSFSGSGTTKGNFKGDGMSQNIFSVDADQYPYYYAPNGKH